MIDTDAIASEYAKNFMKKANKRAMGTDLSKKSNAIQIPSSVDAMFIIKENLQFFFIEFKKMQLEDSKFPLDVNYFKKTIDNDIIFNFKEFCQTFQGLDEDKYLEIQDYKTLVKNVTNFVETYRRCKINLDDGVKGSLKIKPLSTLIILRNIYLRFKIFKMLQSEGQLNHNEKFKINKPYEKIYKIPKEILPSYSKEATDIFSKIEFRYIVVYENGLFNKNHGKRDMDEYFKFLKNLKPYPFLDAHYYTDRSFKKKFLPFFKKYQEKVAIK